MLDDFGALAREMLTSEEGLRHRSRRPIEPEAVFGQIKFDGHYRRFRHYGKDKVYMDFAILAMSLNLKKLIKKVAKALVASFAPVLRPSRHQNTMIYAHHKRILRDFATAA